MSALAVLIIACLSVSVGLLVGYAVGSAQDDDSHE